MAAYYWIKLYHAILDDAKMGRMPDALWRRSVELFLLAGEKHEGGFLPPCEDMAWRLHMSEEALQAELEQLSEFGVVEHRDEGWYVVDFAKRQAAASSTERSRKHRARQRQLKYETAPDRETRTDEQGGDATCIADKNRVQEAATERGSERDAGETKRPTDIDKDSDLNPDTETTPPAGEKSAQDPPPLQATGPPTKKRKPLTDGQRRFMELFGASRYRNGTQKDTILALERTYGLERLLDKGRWAAKLGMGLGKAVVAVESAFKNERKIDEQKEKRSTGAGRRRGQAAGSGVDAAAGEEVQRGLTRDQMDAKLARLERTAAGAGTSRDKIV